MHDVDNAKLIEANGKSKILEKVYLLKYNQNGLKSISLIKSTKVPYSLKTTICIQIKTSVGSKK